MVTAADVPVEDRDTQAVRELLRTAVDVSGLSQAGFARALGTSAPRLSTYLTGDTRASAHFLVRAQRLGHALGDAQAQGLMSAPVTAALMRRHLRDGRLEWVWRMLLQGRDHLTLMFGQSSSPSATTAADPAPAAQAAPAAPWPTAAEHHLVDSWEAAPSSTGAAQWDALLAALTAREYALADLDAPAWARIDPLPEPWAPEHPFLSPDRVLASTPEWLRRLNIFVPARDLITA